MPITEIRPVCACGHRAEMAYQRHLTETEYAALPDGLKPIDGYAVTSVLVCGDCHPGPICQHPDDTPAPCPTCHAKPGQSCTKPDGTLRACEHPERAATQPQPDTCTHAHRQDCLDPRECQCTGDDPAPVRIPRTFLPATAHEQAAQLGFPPALLPIAAQLLADNRLDLTRVREVRSGYTQDNRPALLIDYATGDDGHGHETVETRVIPVEA